MHKLVSITALCLTFASLAMAEIRPETENFHGNYLKYPVISLEKKGVANKINKFIFKSKEELKKHHASQNGAADKISMSYSVIQETPRRLNLLLYSYTYNNGAAHGMYTAQGLSYDLKSGKKAEVKDLLGKTTPEDLDAGIREGRYDFRDAGHNQLTLTDFWKVENVSDECLLLEDGSVTLIYQPYDLAPFPRGNTFVNIPKNELTILKQLKVHKGEEPPTSEHELAPVIEQVLADRAAELEKK